MEHDPLCFDIVSTKTTGNRRFGSEVGNGRRCLLVEGSGVIESLFLFDLNVNDRPVQLARLATYAEKRRGVISG